MISTEAARPLENIIWFKILQATLILQTCWLAKVDILWNCMKSRSMQETYIQIIFQTSSSQKNLREADLYFDIVVN